MSVPVIPGVATDGLKPADLLWASILNKPLLFPPSPHSHVAGDLPVNIAFKDQANTFTADQNFLLGNSAINLTTSGWPAIAIRHTGLGENKFVSPAGDVYHNQAADTVWSTNVGIENFRISNVGNLAAKGTLKSGTTGTAGRIEICRSSDGLAVGTDTLTVGSTREIDNSAGDIVLMRASIERVRTTSAGASINGDIKLSGASGYMKNAVGECIAGYDGTGFYFASGFALTDRPVFLGFNSANYLTTMYQRTSFRRDVVVEANSQVGLCSSSTGACYSIACQQSGAPGYIGFQQRGTANASAAGMGNINGLSELQAYSTSGLGIYTSGGATPILFGINTTEKMRLSSGGRLLVGTTTDDGTSLVQVSGNIAASGTLKLAGYPISASGGTLTMASPYASNVVMSSAQSGQYVALGLITQEGKNGGLTHWDIAHANGRRLDLRSQPAVPITIRPGDSLAATFGTDLSSTFAGNVSASGHLTSVIQSLSTDPTGSDLASGQTRTIKNTSTGTTKVWLNDGGTFKSLTFV